MGSPPRSSSSATNLASQQLNATAERAECCTASEAHRGAVARRRALARHGRVVPGAVTRMFFFFVHTGCPPPGDATWSHWAGGRKTGRRSRARTSSASAGRRAARAAPSRARPFPHIARRRNEERASERASARERERAHNAARRCGGVREARATSTCHLDHRHARGQWPPSEAPRQRQRGALALRKSRAS